MKTSKTRAVRCVIVKCEKRTQNEWITCASCDKPCRRLKNLDDKYRSKYHMSMLENLSTIKKIGMQHFLQQQQEKYRCYNCGATLCVHRNECPSCKTLVWEEKD